MGDQNALSENTDQLMASIEEIRYLRWFGPVTNAFVKLRNEARAMGNVELERNAQSEIDIFSLDTNSPFIDLEAQSRFISRMRSADGTEWPDVKAFTDEQLRYFETRLSSSKNLFLKIRYADVLFERWSKIRGLNKFELGKMLVNLLIEASNLHLAQSKPYYSEFSLSLARAVDVAITLNNDVLLRSALEVLLPPLMSLEDNNLEHIYDMALIVRGISESRMSSSVTISEYEAVAKRVDEARTTFWKSKDLLLSHRMFCEELVYWATFLKWDEMRIQAIRIEIGQSYEDQADYNRDVRNSRMLEANFLEKALSHYINIGHKAKFDELKIRIKKAHAESAPEYKEHSVRFEVPMEAVDEFMRPYQSLTLHDCLSLAASDPRLVIKIESVEKQTGEARKLGSLFFDSPAFVVDGNRKIFQANSEETSTKFMTDHNYKIRLIMNAQLFLKSLFDLLEEERELNADTLKLYVREWPLLDPDNFAIITVGLKRFFEKDYVSALHILVPQLEACTRKMFEKIEMATTSIKPDMIQQEQTFNQFLAREEIKEALGSDIHKYFEFVMVDQIGLNLRNDIAHGLIKSSDCNEINALIVIHLFLILTRFRITEQDQSNP